jgi:hypothetical protein
MSKAMPEGDGEHLRDFVRRLWDINDGKDESKGEPAVAFSPGVGTRPVLQPPVNLRLPPSGQSVPMGMGVVVSAGAALAAYGLDLEIERRRNLRVQKELDTIALDIFQTCLQLQPQPAPQKKALGLRNRRKPKNPKYRHKVYARTRAQRRSLGSPSS